MESTLTREVRPQRLPPLATLSFVLLLGSLFVVASGIADVSHGLEPLLLSMMAIGGAVVGWLLALSPIGGRAATLAALLIGLTAMLFVVGQIGADFIALLGTMTSMPGPVLGSITSDQAPNWTPVAEAAEVVLNASAVMFGRGLTWLTSWIQGNPSFDPVAAALVWGLLLWSVSVWAGWSLKRHNRALIALLPASFLMIATFGYLGADAGPVIWLLAIQLVLLALARHSLLQRDWERRNVRFSQRIWQGVGGWAVLVSVVLVSVAAAVQDVSLDDLLKTARTLSDEQEELRETVTDALGLRDQRFERQRAAMDQLRAPGLPRRHLIGSGPELSEQRVFELNIQSGDEPASTEDRYYLRSTTYDIYTGRGWMTSETEIEGYDAGDLIREESAPSHQKLIQELTIVGAQGPLIHAPGQLVTTNQEFTVEWRTASDPFGAMFTGEETRYRTESLVSVAAVVDLRAAGQEYPEWISPHYLELPSSVPDRVFVLARNLTATQSTPYDRALVIERYLRAFPYTLQVVPPPRGQDIADFFLFDLQEGYCDFYATSMVVLARASGIPARLVVGYIAEQYDEELQAHVVTEAEAHSWVELYFPGHGWIEFEPTGGRAEVTRDGESDALSSGSSTSILDERDLDMSSEGIGSLSSRAPNLYLLAAPIAIVAVLAAFWNRLRFAMVDNDQAALIIYPAMVRLAGRLPVSLHGGATPSEVTILLQRALNDAAVRSRWTGFMGAAAWDVPVIAQAYEDVSYREHPENLPQKSLLLRSWGRIRRRLWLLWIGDKIGGLNIPLIIPTSRR